jgi:hypothetical protein
MIRGLLITVLLVVTLSLATGARAVDGVLEISQVCATSATGCFTGDAAGFPVEIGQAGSYRLTSNLDVTGEASPQDVTAVRITASSVSLDLNGFSIIGPGTPGSGLGVDGASADNVSVISGTIRGMGSDGLSLRDRARVQWLRAEANGLHGLLVRVGGVVEDNISVGNTFKGISANGSVIRNNVASSNSSTGIDGNWGSTLTGNVANNNGSADNGPGLGCSQPCLVIGNTVRDNAGPGLNFTGNAAYGQNLIVGNTLGTVANGVEIGHNSCNGNKTCP